MKPFIFISLLSCTILVVIACSNKQVAKPYTAVHLDSVMKVVEDSIITLEKIKIDSVALELAIATVNNKQQDGRVNKVNIPNKQAPIVTPQIDKDSFEILK